MTRPFLIMLLFVTFVVAQDDHNEDVESSADVSENDQQNMDLDNEDDTKFSRYRRATYRRRYRTRRPSQPKSGYGTRRSGRGRRNAPGKPLCPEIDLMVLIDKSGSQKGRTPAECVDEKNAFVKTLKTLLIEGKHDGFHHRFGLVTFSKRAQIRTGWTAPTTDRGVMSCGGKTNILQGLNATFEEAIKQRNPASKKILVIQTEGQFNDPGVPTTEWKTILKAWKQKFVDEKFEIFVAAYGKHKDTKDYIERREYLATDARNQRFESDVNKVANYIRDQIKAKNGNFDSCKSEQVCEKYTTKMVCPANRG